MMDTTIIMDGIAAERRSGQDLAAQSLDLFNAWLIDCFAGESSMPER